MALFGRVLACTHGYSYQRDGDGYDEDILLNPFVALIEVRSRKNGTPRFIVYGANIFDQPTDPFEERYPENAYTECSSLESGQRIFRSYCRGLVPCFSPAPLGFYKFMVSQGVFFREKPDVTFSYFPRWVKAGKKVGRRRHERPVRVLQVTFGDDRSLLAVHQQTLAHKRTYLTKHKRGLSHEVQEALISEITLLEKEVANIRGVLRVMLKKPKIKEDLQWI